jgi:hypothetical protein
MTKVTDKEKGGDLEFDFADCCEDDIVRVDEVVRDKPAVDFGVTPPNDPCLLIEVKDPGNPRAHKPDRNQFIAEMQTADFLNRQVVEANHNSYIFMTARNPARDRYVFLGVFGIARLFAERKVAALLKTMQDIVNQQISSAPGLPSVILVSERSWNKVLPQYPLRRVSEG